MKTKSLEVTRGSGNVFRVHKNADIVEAVLESGHAQ